MRRAQAGIAPETENGGRSIVKDICRPKAWPAFSRCAYIGTLSGIVNRKARGTWRPWAFLFRLHRPLPKKLSPFKRAAPGKEAFACSGCGGQPCAAGRGRALLPHGKKAERELGKVGQLSREMRKHFEEYVKYLPQILSILPI